jgi:carboxymethylenebutenolidase
MSVIHTDATGLVAGDVNIPAGDVTIPVGGFALPAYRAMPEGPGPHPVLLVVCEIFGVHEHIRDVVRRFAQQGYLVVAPELFVRHGDAGGYTDNQKLIAEVCSQASDAQVHADLDACVAWAAGNGGDTQRLGVTGFCWGGRVTWMYAAHNPAVRAGVAWYGRLHNTFFAGDSTPIAEAGHIRQPMLGLYGAADTGIPVETVEQMRAALAAGGNAASEIVLYPDTPHAFFADYRPNYRAEPAADGWQRCLAWFRRHGVA